MTRKRYFETHSGWGAAVALAAAVAGAPAWVAFLIAFATGVLVEAVQWAFPRMGSATAADVLYTGIGALAAALFVFVGGAL